MGDEEAVAVSIATARELMARGYDLVLAPDEVGAIAFADAARRSALRLGYPPGPAVDAAARMLLAPIADARGSAS